MAAMMRPTCREAHPQNRQRQQTQQRRGGGRLASSPCAWERAVSISWSGCSMWRGDKVVSGDGGGGGLFSWRGRGASGRSKVESPRICLSVTSPAPAPGQEAVAAAVCSSGNASVKSRNRQKFSMKRSKPSPETVKISACAVWEREGGRQRREPDRTNKRVSATRWRNPLGGRVHHKTPCTRCPRAWALGPTVAAVHQALPSRRGWARVRRVREASIMGEEALASKFRRLAWGYYWLRDLKAR